MQSATLHRQGHQAGLLAFLVTVLAGFATAFIDSGSDFSPARIAALLALGLIHILLGTAGAGPFFRSEKLWLRWLYVLLQLGLVGTILYLSRVSGFVAILLFPVVSQTFELLPQRHAVTAAAMAVAVFTAVLAVLFGAGPAIANAPVVIAGVLFVVVFTNVATRERTARKEVERLAAELGAANQKLRAHAEQVEELATARERNRLAREIHDSLGHYLTVINVQLEAARLLLEGAQPAQPPETVRALTALRKAQSLAQEGLGDVRRSVAALRAGPNGTRPLPEALTALADEARAAGIVTQFHLHGQPRSLSAQAELTLYRAAQEALTNVRKQARSSKAEVTLDYAAPERVRLTVADNGVGSAEPSGGFGLLGLRERVQLLGGIVSTQTAPGEGFRLEVEAPG
jgi:signal transduction histidine kinase